MSPQDYMQVPLAELLLWWMNLPDEVSQFFYYHGQFADQLHQRHISFFYLEFQFQIPADDTSHQGLVLQTWQWRSCIPIT